MSRIPDLPEEIEHVPGVLRARVDWPEVDGPAVLEIALDPGSDREETLERVLATLRDVGGVDLGSVRTTGPSVPPPPGAGEPASAPSGPEDLGAGLVGPGGAGPDGAEPGGAQPDGAEPGGTPPDGAEPAGTGQGTARPSAAAGGPRTGEQPGGAGAQGPDDGRPAFRELRIERGATSLRVQVVLDWQGRALTGEATSVATDRGGLHAVARATLDAVAHLLPDGVAGEIEWADAGQFGHERVATVGAALVSDRAQTRVVGGAVVHRDRWDAAVRATLDAFNRQLTSQSARGTAGAPAPAAG